MRKIVVMLMVAAASALAMGAEESLRIFPYYTAAQISELEKQPVSLQTQVKLYQAYDRGKEKRKAAAILHWLLKERPDYPWLGNAIFTSFYECPDAWDQTELKKTWLAALAKQPDNPTILENAAVSLKLTDKAFSRELFAKLLKLQPENFQANHSCGDSYRLSGHPEQALPYYQAMLRSAKDDNQRAQAFDMIARSALSAGKTAMAAEFARNLLDCPDIHSSDRYNACTVLGRAVLREGMPEKDAAFSTNYETLKDLPAFLKYRNLEIPKANIDKAAEWLKKSVSYCGDVYTPEGTLTMILACELYGLERHQDVLDFLETLAKRCKAEPDSSYGMRDYIAALKAGRTPNWRICW